MRVSQNARFRQTVSRPEGDKHPPGAWLAGLLAEHVAARGWHVLESGNWRDNGWYLSTEHAASRLNVIVAPVGMAEWMIQIAPLYVPGILARLFGGRPSASPQSVFELAKEVHAMLSQAGSFENILWRWDGYPDENSTREPVAS